MNNIWVTWGDVFNQSLQNLWFGFAEFAPKLIVAIILFVIGWVLGSIVAQAFERVFAALKIDKLFQSVGVDNLFRKAGMSLNTGYFVGQLVKWFVIIIFLLPSLDLVFGAGNNISLFLKEDVLMYLPNVLVAAFILIIATVLANAVSKLVMASTRALSVHSANMLGVIAKYAIWIFALIIALGELGVADYYMSVLFTGIVAMLALGAGLAFGLGGRDTAARFLSKVSEESKQ